MRETRPQLVKLDTRSLLETVKRLFEQANMIRGNKIYKTRGLLHVDYFFQVIVEKRIINIQLSDLPTQNKVTKRMTLIVTDLTTELKVLM